MPSFPAAYQANEGSPLRADRELHGRIAGAGGRTLLRSFEIPIRTGRRLAALLPGVEFAEIPGAGHLVQYDAPVALATELAAWLTQQTAHQRDDHRK